MDGVGVGRCRFLRSRAVISFPKKGQMPAFEEMREVAPCDL